MTKRNTSPVPILATVLVIVALAVALVGLGGRSVSDDAKLIPPSLIRVRPTPWPTPQNTPMFKRDLSLTYE